MATVFAAIGLPSFRPRAFAACSDIEDWLTDKERGEKNELRRRANLGIAISLFSMAVGLAGLLVALLK